MPTQKYSRQREAIVNYLNSTTCHPTAEVVYNEVKKVYPNISLGTVYRNLNNLANQGTILRLEYLDEIEHFDGNSMPHNHLFCRECHSVVDIDMESIEHINIIANANFNGKVEGHVTYFVGLCPDCYQKKSDING